MGIYLRLIACLAYCSFILIGCTPSKLRAVGPDEPKPIPAKNPEKPEPIAPIGVVQFRDAITLDNGQLAISISPEAGRIFSLVPAGGRNLLWVGDAASVEKAKVNPKRKYLNYGGDKIWPAVQSLWPHISGRTWPPPTGISSTAWTLMSQSKLSVTIQSPIDPELNIQARRKIVLAPYAAKITITNTLTRIKPSPFPVQIWCVTQVHNPEFTLLDMARDVADPDRAWIRMSPAKQWQSAWIDKLPGALLHQPDYTRRTKVGTFGRWIAGVWSDYVFIQRTDYDPTAAYPDASNMQVYTSRANSELETLSPQVHLQPGQSLTNTVQWQVITRPAGEAAAALKAIHAAN